MKIKQEKIFTPVTITLETKEEYFAFVQMIDEVNRIPAMDREFMGHDAAKLAIDLSNYASANV